MAPPITQTFDPQNGEYGQDYALPVGRPIYSPVAGTIGTEDKGKSDWGKRVHVFLSQNDAVLTGFSSFAVGHLSQFAVAPGQHVNAGDLIGFSGGATSDPSSGDSTGPHVEPQFFGRDNQPINPVDVFKRFSTWEEAIFNKPGPSWNWLTGFLPGPAASPPSSHGGFDPTFGIASAIRDASNNAQKFARKVAFGTLAVVLVVVGLFIIFFGDIEKAADKVGDIAEKAPPLAAA